MIPDGAQENIGLAQLTLDRQGLGDDGARALLGALLARTKRSQLVLLELKHCGVSRALREQLCAAPDNSRAFKRLTVLT